MISQNFFRFLYFSNNNCNSERDQFGLLCSARHSGRGRNGLPRQPLFCALSGQVREQHVTSDHFLMLRFVEKELNTHDAAFTVSGQGGMRAVFRLLLLCTGDVWRDETLERMERLSVLNGASHVAIVLLLAGDAAMAAFARLQMKFVSCFLSSEQLYAKLT